MVPDARNCLSPKLLATTAISSSPEQDYFSDGITAELGKFKEFLVIARNSSFQFRGKANDLAEVARRLGAAGPHFGAPKAAVCRDDRDRAWSRL
ncbi:hypothetical protein MES4922_190003 [Mesorhizobium ventifaucium]|uniref:Uncharacterized protein n=1 Tax=Mesorhizobium ventifaucium TaxID=666020 RepID=A0ABN8JH30_9HYPH|nr:hypothetical protein MES4922_190003 [Mesorhizobium ventifaucium]